MSVLVVRQAVSSMRMCNSSFKLNLSRSAAAFFTAYENLKVNLPKQSTMFSNNPALTHMFAASGGEFVRVYCICGDCTRPLTREFHLDGVPHPSADRDREIQDTNLGLRSWSL